MGETSDTAGFEGDEGGPLEARERTADPCADHRGEIFRLLLESASDSISCFDREGRRLCESKTLGEMLSRGAGARQPGTREKPPPPQENSTAFKEALNEALASGERLSRQYSMMIRGEPRHFLTHILPLRREGDSAAGVFAITRDITLQRESERIISLQRDLVLMLNGITDLDQALMCVLKAALEASRLECGGVYLVEGTRGDLVLRSHWGLSGEFVRSALRYDRDTPQADLVFKARTTVRNYRRSGYELKEEVKKEGLRALAVVPLVREGKVLGCINAASRMIDDIPSPAIAAIETIAGILTEFMERLIVEQELRRFEFRLKALQENSSDVIAVVDEEGVIKYMSPSIERLMGYRVEKILGRNVLEYIHPDDFHECRARLAELKERPGGIDRQVMRFRDAHGCWRTLEGILRNLIGNAAIDGYIVNTRDITEMARAEELLRSSEERYRTIFESTGTAMAIMEEDTALSLANLQMMRLLGMEGERRDAERTLFVDRVAPEERELFISQVQTVATAEKLQSKHFSLEVIGAEGRRIPTLTTVAGLPRTGQMVISLIDVTVEKVYERALEMQAEELRDFLSVASHELRHPITLIRGYASILQEMLEEGGESEDLAEHLQSIIQSSVRLSHLAEELLEVSRIEQRRLTPEFRRQELMALVKRAVGEIETRMGRPVKSHFPESDVQIEADDEGITRLLVILLENAVDFSPEEEPVEVRVESLPGKVRIEVMDRGPGIPEAHRQRVFERFYQVEAAKHHSRPGLGLGLYIAKNIAEGHGGRIWCGPREEGGTVFTVELPASAEGA